MNKYEELMQKSAECYDKAMASKDVNLQKFYYNASVGFEIKAQKMKLSEIEGE